MYLFNTNLLDGSGTSSQVASMGEEWVVYGVLVGETGRKETTGET